MRHFCTYFDRNYLTSGLALYRSLERHANPFTLWVLCFDEETRIALTQLALPSLRAIDLADFERGDQALLSTKVDRSNVEYYWTCTPSLPLYLFRMHPEIACVTYVDADLFFVASPQPVFDELGDASILIVAHRYTPQLAPLAATSGIYNVGLLVFRRDQSALDCLTWWRDRCIEWCYAEPDNGRFGDQKYLDDWPRRFARVVELQHLGAGLAPWNIGNYGITLRGSAVYVDGAPLIFFHFHNFRLYGRSLYRPGAAKYALTTEHEAWIYDPYVEQLLAIEQFLTAHGISYPRPSLSVRQMLVALGQGEITWRGHHRLVARMSTPVRIAYRSLRRTRTRWREATRTARA